MRQLSKIGKAEKLTPREKEIYALMLAGKTNKEIADELEIAVNTVKVHIRHMYLVNNPRKI